MSFVEDMKMRTRKLALDIILFCRTLPRAMEHKIITGQLIRAATSTGANYRAACRAKSTPDFINKLLIVEEEADESVYWLELLEELNEGLKPSTTKFIKEFDEILSIIVAAKKTTRNKIP